MSKKEKLWLKIQRHPKDFTWSELTRLLKTVGYEPRKKGKTGGARRQFIHPTAPPINLHKPHPQNTLKRYVIDDILEILEKEGMT